MSSRSQRGSASALVLVLVLLVGAVGWNFHRNLEAESREFRPYRSYALEDLDALIGAYEQAAEKAGARYDRATDRRTEAQGRGDVMGNVKEFERVQNAGRTTRAAREDYASARASLELLREERSRRAGERSQLRVFLRRAFTF
jgi:hypothetical protein